MGDLRRVFFGAAVAAICSIATVSQSLAAVSVTSGDYTGTRSTAVSGQIVGAGSWDGIDDVNNGGQLKDDNGFQISWNISNVGGAFPWSYSYMISGEGGTELSKGLSHIILEISPGVQITAFSDFSTTPDDPTTYTDTSNGNSNPNLPTPPGIYGLSFNGSSKKTYNFSFLSMQAPVWGSFYAKDGNDVPATYAYNVGLGLNISPDNQSPFDNNNWIARPDGGTLPPPPAEGVPEPASVVAWSLLAVVGLACGWRKNRAA